MAAAITNRIAAKDIGGKSRRPTLIASQVELQTTQRVSQAAGIFQPIRCTGDSRANRPRRKAAASLGFRQNRVVGFPRPTREMLVASRRKVRSCEPLVA